VKSLGYDICFSPVISEKKPVIPEGCNRESIKKRAVSPLKCHPAPPSVTLREVAGSIKTWILRLRFTARRMTVRGVDSATPFHSAQNDGIRDAGAHSTSKAVTLRHHPSPGIPIRHPARSRRVHKDVDSATPLRSAQNDRKGRGFCDSVSLRAE